MIINGVIEPLELGRFPYKKSTLEDYVGKRGLKRLGRKKWERHVEEVVERLIAALKPDDVVLGGGNAKKLKRLLACTASATTPTPSSAACAFWEDGVDRRTASPGHHRTTRVDARANLSECGKDNFTLTHKRLEEFA